MRPRQVSILAGRTFAVSDIRGDVVPDPDEPAGLFYRDVRHLSRWEVRLNGHVLRALSGDAVDYDSAVFFLHEPTGSVYRNAALSLIRRRHVGGGLQERLELTNYDVRARAIEMTVLFAADFADIFEVKDKLRKTGRLSCTASEGQATMVYERGDFRRETQIRAPAAFFTEESLTFRVTLEPGQTWAAEIEVHVATTKLRPVLKRHQEPNMPVTLRDWLAAAPTLETDWDDLRRSYQQSLVDLAALRFYPDEVRGSSLVAAGLPWFMALFGRDSLITSYQTLPFVPEICRTTLRALAARQAHEIDDFRDAEPGKILHELRHGELVYFGQRPQSPYYGAADATPLFLIVLDEYERWTGDVQTVQELEGAARGCLAWLEEHGDRNSDGFIEYQTRNAATGLVNQCWKDSWNSIVHTDGTLAALPRATCELQGYAYDARIRTARLAREIWQDPELADRLEAEARQLQATFVEHFWMPEENFYALALAGDGQLVRTLTSNVGHLLWSGIVPEEHVEKVASRLLESRFFSGWGVRTMAAGQQPYNPMEYHNGSVWPHDNSLIVAGLHRYGQRAAAATIAQAVLEAAPHLDFRLPEALVGTPRVVSPVPVPYPSACSPQAWASGAPLLFLRSLLGLEPKDGQLSVDPHLPPRFGRVALRNIPGRWGQADAVA